MYVWCLIGRFIKYLKEISEKKKSKEQGWNEEIIEIAQELLKQGKYILWKMLPNRISDHTKKPNHNFNVNQ